MLQLFRTLSAPLLSLAFLIVGSGLLNTFVSIRLELENFSPETIGAVASALYFGILIGSLRLGTWIERAGHTRAFITFACFSTVLVLAQSLWINPIYWALLRFGCGLCTAGVFIVIESWLLLQSPPSARGAALSLYLAVFYAALSGGQFLLGLTDPESVYPFCIAASLFCISVFPLLLQKPSEPKIEHSTPLTLGQMFKMSPLGFLGGIVSGMLLAAIYGLVPVFAKELGMQVSEIGILMGIIIFGGLAFQWPIAWWADKGNRRKAINTVSLMTSVLCVWIAQCTEASSLILVLGWFFGGFSFTIYPLSMAYVCEKVSQDQIVSATGGFVLSYGIGAIAGPLLAPLAMSLFGNGGLFYFIAAISSFLCIAGLRKDPVFEK